MSKAEMILSEERLDGRVVVLTLNRPDAANAIDDELAIALELQAQRIAASERIEAVILTGSGKVFCSGGDVSAFKSALLSGDGAGQLPVMLDRIATRIHATLESLVGAGPLLIAAVNGPATGAGLGLLCACDFAYARPNATLRPGFSRLGLSPDTGTTHFLQRIVGYRKALEILLRGDAVNAEAALALGLFNELIDAEGEAFMEQVLIRTGTLIASGRAACETRRLLRESESQALHEQLQQEQRSLVALSAHTDVTARLKKALGA